MSDSSNPSSAMQSGSSMTMIENSRGNIGVGNYKGVMLCNRPFGGTTGIKYDNLLPYRRSGSNLT
jgi:hypothetical protein